MPSLLRLLLESVSHIGREGEVGQFVRSVEEHCKQKRIPCFAFSIGHGKFLQTFQAHEPGSLVILSVWVVVYDYTLVQGVRFAGGLLQLFVYQGEDEAHVGKFVGGRVHKPF